MTDDPRDILNAAGVECAEYEHLRKLQEFAHEFPLPPLSSHPYTSTILALARLVAKYKWAAESLQTELLQAALDHDFSIPTLAARLAEYEADHA